jgi:2-polyprenyl-3-methyl-5-hydroxy-6-metoxy-1,4-benzoquinol methylase
MCGSCHNGNNACPPSTLPETMDSFNPLREEVHQVKNAGENPVEHTFDKGYWERHWEELREAGQEATGAGPGNPYIARETAELPPGTALDAGCGEGVEAEWLAAQGWDVVGADISAAALSEASARTAARPLRGSVRWVEADLTSWEPEQQFDLVMTSYAHPAMPHLEFYRRLSAWVAPGGTLLIVGHLHGGSPASEQDGAHDQHAEHHRSAPHADQQHSEHPPVEATVDLASIVAGFDSPEWTILTAEEQTRTFEAPGGGHGKVLHDVIVKAARR